MAPPQTPTPHRFLVSKKQPPPSSAAAPTAVAASSQQHRTPRPRPPASQQFLATPRFSLHSTPRASGPAGAETPAPSAAAPSTIAAPPSSIFRHRPDDPISDAIESSPAYQDGDFDGDNEGEGGGNGGGDSARDHNEMNRFDQHAGEGRAQSDPRCLDIVAESSPLQPPTPEPVGRDQPYFRPAKRRRISVSSALSSDEDSPPSPSPSLSSEEQVQADYCGEREATAECRDPEDPFDLEFMPEDDQPADDFSDMEVDTVGSPSAHQGHPFAPFKDLAEDKASAPTSTSHQPVFHKAPRFKLQIDGFEQSGPAHHRVRGHCDPMPDVFSPHRRGAKKYVPGGLAAGLRDWLVEAEAGVGAVAGASIVVGEWAAELLVDSVRVGPGVLLVRGSPRHETETGIEASASATAVAAATTETPTCWILGESRGGARIAKKGEVRAGVTIGIRRPTWEVTLPYEQAASTPTPGDLASEERWAVACDWVILNDSS